MDTKTKRFKVRSGKTQNQEGHTPSQHVGFRELHLDTTKWKGTHCFKSSPCFEEEPQKSCEIPCKCGFESVKKGVAKPKKRTLMKEIIIKTFLKCL